MGAIYGQQSNFSASDGRLRLNIEDLISKYPKFKYPILNRWNGSVFKGTEIVSHKTEWSNRDLRPRKALLVNATLSTSATSFVVDTAAAFNKDDIIENVRTQERIHVKATEGAGTVVSTAVRGFQDSTAVAMVAGDVLVRVSSTSPQGADADNMVITGYDDLYNFTQIYEDVVEMSDSQHKGFVRGDETQSQLISRIQEEKMELLNDDLLIGRRYRDASRKISTQGGVKNMVDLYAPDNKVDFGGANVWDSDINAINKFEDLVQKFALIMGNKPTIYATYKTLRKLRFIQDDIMRTERDDETRGIGVVSNLDSGMGKLDIVQIVSRNPIFDNYTFMVDESAVGYKAHKGRGWFTEELAKTGDNHKWQVVGEYSSRYEMPKASIAYLYNMGV